MEINKELYYVVNVEDVDKMKVSKIGYPEREEALDMSATMAGTNLVLQGLEILIIGKYEQSMVIEDSRADITKAIRNKAKALNVNLGDMKKQWEEKTREEITYDRGLNKPKFLDK
jgi:rRNA processing protein Krr1/Pno1